MTKATTIALNTATEQVTKTETSVSTPVHLSLNATGATKIGIVPSTVNAATISGGRKSCSCGWCKTCRAQEEISGDQNIIALNFNITSYTGAVRSDNSTVTFTSVDSFKEFKKFIADLDVDTLFPKKEEVAPAKKAA